MNSMREEICKGYNNLILEQHKIKEDDARFYFIKFNTRINVVHKGVKLHLVRYLRYLNGYRNSVMYSPSGSSALYKTVIKAIKIGEKIKNPSERVILIIMTYGSEDREFGNWWKVSLRHIFKAKIESEDWKILYIGKNALQWVHDTEMNACDSIEFNRINPVENFEIINSALTQYRLFKENKNLNLSMCKT
jgi:hypothetical protein